ncbi:hypothetical protein GXP67_05240 [Rhodocytophaga rosea]|uniref:Uncharacterized protein n=1 Tax=Rhodocytophaga rosea TaxID=2704465 RepID=A0A6C0GDS3_9BACT|nr:hypothetical protein [Rhodocytophaga rosea]QHT66115.1 hypothetical protein GXP67_05240 [Rhodocytophaga rosea]
MHLHAEYIFEASELKTLLSSANDNDLIAIQVMLDRLGQKKFVMEVCAVNLNAPVSKPEVSGATHDTMMFMDAATATRPAVKGCPRPPSC